MSEMELKVTVKCGTNTLGERVRRLVVDGDANEDGIILASNGYTLEVVKVERADGLPLAIEEDFQDWFHKSGIQSMHRAILFKAYCAGRALK